MQETNSVNAPSSIENKQSDRLGFMEGEGRVPDDFNTMGTDEIEDLFFIGQWELSRTFDVQTPKNRVLDMANWWTNWQNVWHSVG